MEINGAAGGKSATDIRKEELAGLTVPKLKELAGPLGVDGNKIGRKDELIEAIIAAEERPPELPDTTQAPPPVPKEAQGPTGKRVTMPEFLGLSREEIYRALELGEQRFIHGGPNVRPIECLKGAAAFVKAAKTGGLI